jgi:hypothetical protein
LKGSHIMTQHASIMMLVSGAITGNRVRLCFWRELQVLSWMLITDAINLSGDC